MALSGKCKDNEMVVLDGLDLSEIKTKAVVELLEVLGLKNVLVVIPERDDVLEKSARNMPHTKVLRSEGLNVYDILRYRHLVLMKDAVPKIEAALLGGKAQST